MAKYSRTQRVVHTVQFRVHWKAVHIFDVPAMPAETLHEALEGGRTLGVP